MPRVVITLEAQTAEAVRAIQQVAKAQKDTFDVLKAGNPTMRDAHVRVSRLTTAKQEAFRATQQWQGVLQVLPGQLGAVASQATTLATALKGPGGVVVAIGAVVAAGVGLAKSLADDIERLTNVSRQTGLAVSSLQAFEHAAKQAGEAPETLVQGLGRVNQEINQLLLGKAKAGEAFAAIGVDLRELVRAGATTEEILEATARALAAIEDPARRAAAQMDLFGTRGRAMSTVLDALVKDGIGGYVKGLEAAGIVTSQKTNEMAIAFDVMVDQQIEAAKGFVMRLKGVAVEALVEWRKLFTGVPPGTRSALEGGIAVEPPAVHEIVRPGIAAAGAPRIPRVIPPDPAERAAADARTQFLMANEAKLVGMLLEQQAQDRREIFEAELQAHREQGEARTAVIIGSWEMTAAEVSAVIREALAPSRTVEIIGSWEATGAEIGEAIQRGLREKLDRETAAFNLIVQRDAINRELGTIQTALDTMALSVEEKEALITRQVELFSQRRIMTYLTEADRRREITLGEQEAAIQAMERRASAGPREAANLLRMQAATAQASGDAWGLFTTRFQQEALSWGTTLERFGQLGAGTAQTLHTAFEESFFQFMKGNLDDFDDIWKGALDAALRQIAAFLASEAVQALIKLGTDIVIGVSTEGGGDGITGIDIVDDVLKSLGIGQRRQVLEQQSTDEAQRRLELEQQTTGESERRLRLEQRRGISPGPPSRQVDTPFGPVNFGTDIEATVGGFRDLLGFLANPIAGVASMVTNVVNAFRRGAATAELMAEQQAGLQAAMAITQGMRERERQSYDDLTEAVTDLTAAQTDLAIETFDVTEAMRDLTTTFDPGLVDAVKAADEATNDLSKSVTDLGDSAAAAAPGVGAPGTATGPVDPTTGQTVGPVPAFGPAGFGGGGPPGFAGVGPGQSPGPAGDPGGAGAGPSTGGGVGASGTGGGPGFELRRQDVDAITEATERAREVAERLRIEFGQSLLQVDALTLELTDTSAGVGIAAEEARRFTASLVSGVAPTSEYAALFRTLAQEHGPEFARQVQEAVLQLGLSNIEAQKLLGSIQAMGQGVEVPVVYQLSTRGSPPPGAGGPPIAFDPADRGRQFGLLEGPVPGPFGAPRRMTLHGGEVVATPDQAAAILMALRGGVMGGTGDKILAAILEQNRILREAVRSSRGGRVVGAAV